MSNAEARRGRPPEWDRLELAVRRLLDELASTRERAARAEARALELETAVRDMASGDVDPTELQRSVDGLARENADLRARLDQARAHVQRIVARLDFLQEDR